ncbi:MAG: hypothetical protein M1155_00270 [Patescibacteria group bacterium]|nr:hypothetical protein [Patescibacteria group bacterium]
MSRSKILITILFLGLGFGGAYFIVSGSAPAAPQANNSSLDIVNNNPVGTEISLSQASSTVNLSEVFAKKIAAEMTSVNPNGAITMNGQNYVAIPKPENLANDLFAEAQKNFDPKSLYPTINDSDIKISNDNSKDALVNYFLSFNAIILSNGQKLPKSLLSSVENIKSSDFIQMVNVYNSTIKDFYNLTVPAELLAIDKKEIELLTAEKNIYQALANMDQDPFVASLAVNELSNVYQQYNVLKNDKNTFIKNNQLIK